MSHFQNNSIFWVETEKISPNPFQPRREFDQNALNDLAESIRQYGVLQPLVVTRREELLPDEGMHVRYELIAGERRLRASRIAGITQVPVIIRSAEENNQEKLEIAIIENLQREDLNPVDRALAFRQLNRDFSLSQTEIGRKMGKSREYVSNSLRLLSLPDEIRDGLSRKLINEGHTRPLLMLNDKPDEQLALFQEIIARKLSVRESETLARRNAQEKVRKGKFVLDPRTKSAEETLTKTLGTRVHIEKRAMGGKLVIDYADESALEDIIKKIQEQKAIKNDGAIGNLVPSYSKLEMPENNFKKKTPEQSMQDRQKPSLRTSREQEHQQQNNTIPPQTSELAQSLEKTKSADPIDKSSTDDTQRAEKDALRNLIAKKAPDRVSAATLNSANPASHQKHRNQDTRSKDENKEQLSGSDTNQNFFRFLLGE